jgi:peptidoglycan hydrolase-like protein with peptidoglycan-binding domain
MAYLIDCLVQLRKEFNTLNPDRDKGADGWIGDEAHQAKDSDHNPDSLGRVLALDIDSTGPWPKPFGDLISGLVGRCQRGDERRLEYIISNRHIYRHSQNFVQQDYSGSDPHTGHAHFSGRHDHYREDDISNWGIAMKPYTHYEALEGLSLPVLHEGDTDPEHLGYHMVWRAQKAIGSVAVTGYYGPETSKAVKALGFGDGKTIDLDVWTNLYGLSRKAAS